MAYTYGPGGARAALNVTTTTLIKSGPGTLFRVVVVTPPTVVGGIYDSATTGGISATNQIAPIATALTADTVLELLWPCENGIVVNPGTGGVVSVSYT